MERSFSQKLSYPHLNPKPNTRDRQNESVRLQNANFAGKSIAPILFGFSLSFSVQL